MVKFTEYIKTRYSGKAAFEDRNIGKEEGADIYLFREMEFHLLNSKIKLFLLCDFRIV